VGLFLGLVTVLGMSLFIFINLKFNSVYYAQHIPHKEGTDPDVIMLMENMGWAYTPEIEGISYDDDGSYAITREKGTKTSVLSFTNGTLFFFLDSGESYLFDRNFSIQHALSNFFFDFSLIIFNIVITFVKSMLDRKITIKKITRNEPIYLY